MFSFFKKQDEVKNYRKLGLETNPKTSNGWYTCVHCGKKLRAGDVEIDHILPRSQGGANTAKNLQCLCRTCNRSKGKKMDDTKRDLKKRTGSYNERIRQDVLREEIKRVKKEIREDLKKFDDGEIKQFLSDPNVDSTDKQFLLREAKRRKML